MLITLAEVGGFVALMLVVGRRLFPWILWHVAKTGSRELFTLCVVAAAVSIAYGSAALFGVSFALGAFLAGMVLRESEFSHRAAEETLPLQDAFAVLFFVSVGMLFDPAILVEQPLAVLAVVAIIMVGKSLAAAALVLVLRYPAHTALMVAASLAQIGEFSFILAGLGMSLGLLPTEGQSLIVAGALFSIALNPFVFSAFESLYKWMRQAGPARGPYGARPQRVGRAAHEHRRQVPVEPGGAGGLGTRGQKHCRCAHTRRCSLCGGGGKPRIRRRAARAGHPGRLGRRHGGRGADPGPHRPGQGARRGNA